jgi:hypothetical protein
MLQVIEERGLSPDLASVPGGKTGLVTRTLKGIGKDDDFQVVEVYDEAHRGDEWVRVEDAPKPLRITHQMVQVGNVMLIGGPPPDMATPGDDQ